jgi:hypothetical protein
LGAGGVLRFVRMRGREEGGVFACEAFFLVSNTVGGVAALFESLL